MYIKHVIVVVLMACANAWAQSGPAVPAEPAPPAKSVPHPTAEVLPPLIPARVPPPAVDLAAMPDFSALREAYAQRADFSARCEINHPMKAFAAQYEAKNFAQAAAIMLPFLTRCPVDAQAHAYAALALNGAGDSEAAGMRRRWFFGLTDSAMKSGDGLTPETPLVTISVAEEYAILFRMRRVVTRQVLQNSPTLLDALETRDEKGEARTFYFEPRWHFIRLAHEFPLGK